MATNYLSSKKIVLFFLFISLIFISNAFAREDFELVKKICNQQDDVDVVFCLNALSDSSLRFATEIKELASFSINMEITNTSQTRKLFQEKKDGPPELLKSLPECIASYDIVVSKYEDCANEKDWDAVDLNIHASMDAINHCQDIADENGAHDSLITTNNIGALQGVALSEALAVRLTSLDQ